jgi:hypothetical protein
LPGALVLQGSGKRSLGYVAAAILVAGVLVSAALVLAPMSRAPTTVTETSVRTTTETTTSTSTTTLAADCLTSQSYGYSYGTLVAGTASPAIICIQVYEFNSTSTFVVNATSLLKIVGYAPSSGQAIDAAANFTVAASLDQLTLGGPANAGEDTVLAFAITARAGASGTYQLGVQGFDLESQATMCGPNGDLVAGSGQPSYLPSGGVQECIVFNTSAGGSFSVPGVGYPVPADALCYRIISLTNSTQ